MLRTVTRTRAREPSESRLVPLMGAVRSLSSSCASRSLARPAAAAAQARSRAHTASSAFFATGPDDAYQGSRPTTGYAESSVTECSICGCRAMNDCVNQVPYESPYQSTLPRREARSTAAMSSTAYAVPNRSAAYTRG